MKIKSKPIFNNLLILFLFLIVSSFISICYSQFPDFDFYSYHYYNGWAFLNNRINVDFLPCQFRSYFNPILDSLIYLSIEKLNNHPILFIAFSGFKYGILMFLAYKIYDYIFSEYNKKNKIIAVSFCMFLAVLSPVVLYCINFDNNDMQTAIIVLFGFYIYLKNIFSEKIKHRDLKLFIASLLIGAAIGLKLSNISYAIALLLTVLCMHKKISSLKNIIIPIFCGLVIGFLITGGYWSLLLLYKFKNPVFPYFNNLFHSPYADANSVLTMDYNHLKPVSIFDYIFYPLKNSYAVPFVGLEKRYYDIKIALGFISILSMFILIWRGNLKLYFQKLKNENIILFLLYFTTFTYYINLALFATMRYLLPLFIIVPIIIYCFIKIISRNKYFKFLLISVALLSVIFYNGCVKSERRVFYMTADKIVEIQDLGFEDNSLVLCGTYTSCFVAPKQNKNVNYVGFSLPYDLVKKGSLNKSRYKNSYFSNHFLENYLSEISPNYENIYFIYSSVGLGEELSDKRLYEIALKRNLNIKVNLSKCRSIKNGILGGAYKDLKICKIK